MAGHTKNKNLQSRNAVLTIRVKGPGIRSGRIAVSDLVKISEELQSTVYRQAESMEGLQTLHPGPVKDNIKNECTLDLIGIGKGSTTLQYGWTQAQETLPDHPHFGAAVVSSLALTIKHLGNGRAKETTVDEGVLQGLYSLSGIAEGKRISTIELVAPRAGQNRRIAASVNRTVRERVAERLSKPRIRHTEIDGILDMADFKTDQYKCRIDPAIGASVNCTFDEWDAPIVQALLRKPVRIKGDGTFQPYTDRLETFHIRTIERLPSLSLGERDFQAGFSLQELAKKQKVSPVRDPKDIPGGFPSDENIDDFLEEIYKSR
jgi:hypothetical protein